MQAPEASKRDPPRQDLKAEVDLNALIVTIFLSDITAVRQFRRFPRPVQIRICQNIDVNFLPETEGRFAAADHLQRGGTASWLILKESIPVYFCKVQSDGRPLFETIV